MFTIFFVRINNDGTVRCRQPNPQRCHREYDSQQMHLLCVHNIDIRLTVFPPLSTQFQNRIPVPTLDPLSGPHPLQAAASSKTNTKSL